MEWSIMYPKEYMNTAKPVYNNHHWDRVNFVSLERWHLWVEFTQNTATLARSVYAKIPLLLTDGWTGCSIHISLKSLGIFAYKFQENLINVEKNDIIILANVIPPVLIDGCHTYTQVK